MGNPCERSKKKDGDFFCNHEVDKYEYFFKVMIGDFRERITIPDAFAKHLRGKLPKNIKLKSRKGCIFDARITCYYNVLVLQSGWNAFVSAHDLKLGDFLIFKYNGISQLEVRIFDPSGCEKVLSCIVRNNTTIDGQELIDISSSSDDIPINSPQRERSNQGKMIVNPPEASEEDDLEAHFDSVPPYILPSGTVLTDVQRTKLDKMVLAIQSSTPIYGCILNRSSLYAQPSSLYLSRKYADIYLPFDNESLILERHGKKWKVWCCAASSNKMFTKGWIKFAGDNNLKVGDFCLFEPVKKKNKQYIMRVHIIRKKMKSGRLVDLFG